MKARILALEERNDDQVAGLRGVNEYYITEHGFLSGFACAELSIFYIFANV